MQWFIWSGKMDKWKLLSIVHFARPNKSLHESISAFSQDFLPWFNAFWMKCVVTILTSNVFPSCVGHSAKTMQRYLFFFSVFWHSFTFIWWNISGAWPFPSKFSDRLTCFHIRPTFWSTSSFRASFKLIIWIQFFFTGQEQTVAGRSSTVKAFVHGEYS